MTESPKRPARRGDQPRHRGREAALQMLYQWQVGKIPIEDVVRTYWSLPEAAGDRAPERVREFATGLLKGTVSHLDDIDRLIADVAQHWRPTRMAIMDRLIMRLAVYEFLHVPETPRAVAINEALELAKTFSTDDGAKFINGMLDAIHRNLQEKKAEGGRGGAAGNVEEDESQ